MLAESGEAPLQVLSRSIAKVVEGGVHVTEGGGHCDWVLGWAELNHHAPLDTLVPRSDASTLLDLLWMDRKLFLKALSMTYSPGLSGIMFLLWRQWHLARYVVWPQEA